MEDQFDGLFLTCLEKVGGYNNFFNALFGFFLRKTDFYKSLKTSRTYIDDNFDKWHKEYEAKVAKGKKKLVIHSSKEKKTPLIDLDDTTDELQKDHIMPSKEHGANKEKYSWSQQDIKEIQITFKVPPTIKGKDIKVEAKSNHLFVGIKGESPIIDSDLYEKIKADSLVWNLDDLGNEKLATISFEKMELKWWESVEKDDKVKIDISKIFPEASRISDIEDPETRAQAEKVMYENRLKMSGKTAPLIEEFMEKHPEMDFSKVKKK